MANKTYYQLLNEVKDYTPADKHFTSDAEIQMLNEHFGLAKMTRYELQNLRDMAVMFFDMLENNEIEMAGVRTEKFYSYMVAMQSITAVIDYYKYNVAK